MAAPLDSFLIAAARLTKSAGEPAKATLLREAPQLLLQHPDRGLEIALAVSRWCPLEASLIGPLASALALSASERLSSSSPPSRRLCREAVATYVTLRHFGSGAELAAALIGAEAAAAVAQTPLEALESAASLARLASVTERPSTVDGSRAAGAVALALQKPLAKAAVLEALSGGDLCAAVVGISRSEEVDLDALEAVLLTAADRVEELATRPLWDLARAGAELSLRLPSFGPLAKLFGSLWLRLATVTQTGLRAGGSEAVLTVAGLSRLAAAVPPASPLFTSLQEALLKPNGQALLELACSGQERMEVVGTLLFTAGADEWPKLLQHAALQGFPQMPPGPPSAERLLSFMDMVAGSSPAPPEPAPLGASAFPPFFDFAFEELLMRSSDLTPVQLRQAARLLGRAHLEKPELLEGMVKSLAQALLAHPEGKVQRLPELGLRLSAFAGLFVRLASQVAATKEQGQPGLDAIVTVLERDGVLCEGALQAPVTARDVDGAFLGLSAFVQALHRIPASSHALLRQHLVSQGQSLLNSMAAAQSLREAVTPQHGHIFVTALRALCLGHGAEVPLPVMELLRQLVASAAAAPGNRDARLLWEVLSEIAADPKCPDSLKETLPPPAVRVQEPNRPAIPSAQDRLRASMAAASEAPLRPPPERPSLFSRLFGS